MHQADGRIRTVVLRSGPYDPVLYSGSPTQSYASKWQCIIVTNRLRARRRGEAGVFLLLGVLDPLKLVDSSSPM